MGEANGECFNNVRGRFADKSGQQVGSFFQSGSDNDKIKHIYGNYSFWSWCRYWYIDTANFVTLLLMDKGYYDYDYQESIHIKDKVNKPNNNTMPDISYEETQKMLSKYGLGIYANETKNPKDMSMEELQAYAMEQNNDISLNTKVGNITKKLKSIK